MLQCSSADYERRPDAFSSALFPAASWLLAVALTYLMCLHVLISLPSVAWQTNQSPLAPGAQLPRMPSFVKWE